MKTNHFFRRLAWTVPGLSLLFLAACQHGQPYRSAPSYVGPTTGNIAKLTIAPDIKMSSANYKVFAFDDAQSCTGPRTITSGKGSVSGSQTPIQRSIAAGDMTTVAFRAELMSSYCEIAGSFMPKPNHIYVLRTAYEGGRCSMGVEDVTDGTSSVEGSFVPRKGSNTGRCTPLPAEVRADMAKSRSASRSRYTLNDFKDLLPAK